jgi:hypothetical protein
VRQASKNTLERCADAEDAAQDYGDGEDELAVRDFVAHGGWQSMDRKAVGDGASRIGEPFDGGRRQTSSNHAEFGNSGRIVEM